MMKYHTNHCWCSKSIHNNKHFDGEVMVIVGNTLSTDFLDDNVDEDIKDFDFENLTETSEFFHESDFNSRMDYYKEKGKKQTKDDIEMEKMFCMKKTVTLKQEVIDWLNDNIKDNKDTTEDTPLNERKAWAIGNDEYNSNQSYRITVFFARQKDALKFIDRWSIYKKPTFYFDYFHDERREMEITKILKITNKYREENGLELIIFGKELNHPHKISTNLDESTYIMIDWENDEEYD